MINYIPVENNLWKSILDNTQQYIKNFGMLRASTTKNTELIKAQNKLFENIINNVFEYCIKYSDVALTSIESHCRRYKIPVYLIAKPIENMNNDNYELLLVVTGDESYYARDLIKYGYESSIDNYINLSRIHIKKSKTAC